MKLYRERYFEDHIAVPDVKKPGKVKYVYNGQYVEPFVKEQSLNRWKTYMAVTELINIMIFLSIASIDVLFNYANVTVGIGALAIIPWMLEVWSVFRFIVAKKRMKETDRQSIEKFIEMGAVLRALLLILMVCVGSVIVIRARELQANIIAILGHLCMGMLSFLILRLYKRVYYYTYSDDGR